MFEYAKLHFELADLETAAQEGKIVSPRISWLAFFGKCVKRDPTKALKNMYRKVFLM